MKTAKELIGTIRINDANIDYIRNHPARRINGSLFESIERIMKAYAEQEVKEALEKAADNAKNNLEFPCEECEVGEMKTEGFPSPNGIQKYVCDRCGHEERFP